MYHSNWNLKCGILLPGYVPQREFRSVQNVSSKKGFGRNNFEHGIIEFWERSFKSDNSNNTIHLLYNYKSYIIISTKISEDIE